MTHGKLTSIGLVDEYALKAWALICELMLLRRGSHLLCQLMLLRRGPSLVHMLKNAFKAWAPHSMI